jgi:hypothetical protein
MATVAKIRIELIHKINAIDDKCLSQHRITYPVKPGSHMSIFLPLDKTLIQTIFF